MTNYYDMFLSLKKVKIDSKDMNSYFKGLWWLIKRSKTLFLSLKNVKKVTYKKSVLGCSVLHYLRC